MAKLIEKLIPGKKQGSRRKVKFVLLFQGRTGSTYFTDCLNTHPEIRMDPEVWGGWGFQVPENQREEYSTKQKQWLSHFYEHETHRGVQAIGFKTKIDDVLDKRHFIKFLREQNVRIIHMTRRNMVKLVISEINARRLYDKASTWNLESEEDRLGTFELDLEKFDAQLQWREQIEQWLASFIRIINLPTETLCYEDMLADENKFFGKVYDFLDVPFAETVGKTLKNTPNDLQEIVSNYAEFLAKYKYSIYEPMILDT